MVGLLDLVVIAGCVGLIERERGRERSELFILFDGVVYIILMSYMFLSKKEKKWVICKNKNWDIRWVVKWDYKIDKVSFECVK